MKVTLGSKQLEETEIGAFGMGDTITLNFTPEQYKFFLDSCIEEVNRVDAKASSLKTSPLQHYDLCDYLFGKCATSGSFRRLIAERRPSSPNSRVKLVEVEDGSILRPVVEGRSSSQNYVVKVIEVEDDVNSLNEDGGSWAASEHRNLDAGYDSGFEGGSSKEPNVA
ncbi:hypothetical protein CTI12_AA190830 [Artemisia annua]|uniref:Uncharacterized protein n=1 Tax=Artemisia annua TaxID=35608 RepID=A0A2U1P5J0_ARTAN|nr:hypothetical protein CTI12_AA190830 [Artemisia annua]